MKRLTFLAVLLTIASAAFAQGPTLHGLVHGFLTRAGHPVFPIGIYEMPKTDAELRTMAQSGINLVRCGNKDDLDRAQAAGMMGWVPLPLSAEDPAKFRQILARLRP